MGDSKTGVNKEDTKIKDAYETAGQSTNPPEKISESNQQVEQYAADTAKQPESETKNQITGASIWKSIYTGFCKLLIKARDFFKEKVAPLVTKESVAKENDTVVKDQTSNKQTENDNKDQTKNESHIDRGNLDIVEQPSDDQNDDQNTME